MTSPSPTNDPPPSYDSFWLTGLTLPSRPSTGLDFVGSDLHEANAEDEEQQIELADKKVRSLYLQI
jgi:hypothetical protein